jgi:hypothetical protein
LPQHNMIHVALHQTLESAEKRAYRRRIRIGRIAARRCRK